MYFVKSPIPIFHPVLSFYSSNTKTRFVSAELPIMNVSSQVSGTHMFDTMVQHQVIVGIPSFV